MKLVPKLLFIELVLAFILGAYQFLSTYSTLSALGVPFDLTFLSGFIFIVVDPVILVVIMYNMGKTIDLGARYAAAFDSLLIGALIGEFSGYTLGFVAAPYLPASSSIVYLTGNVLTYLIAVAESIPLTALSLSLVAFGALAFGFFSKKSKYPAEGQS